MSKGFKLALLRAPIRRPRSAIVCVILELTELTELTLPAEAIDTRTGMAEVKVKRETSVSDPAEVENRSGIPNLFRCPSYKG